MMKTIVLTTLVLLLLAFGAGNAGAECITLYGNSPSDVDCGILEPAAKWIPVLPPGEILLFKNIWGRGKGNIAPRKSAGVGLAGPLCWNGNPPSLTLRPTSPQDWKTPDNTEWQAVKMGGACQVCCIGSEFPPPVD